MLRYCYLCSKDTQTVNECCVKCGLSKVSEMESCGIDIFGGGNGTPMAGSDSGFEVYFSTKFTTLSLRGICNHYQGTK